MIFRVFIFFAAVFNCGLLQGQTAVINEFMSSNGNTIRDEDGDTPDWIELYNPHNVLVNLSGCYLSDDSENLTRWEFPEKELQPDSFLLVFASGKDRREGELHTNFSIASAGEPLYLYCDGAVADHVPATEVPRDRSYGRVADGADTFVRFFAPTPGASNALSAPETELFFDVQGGMYDRPFDLALSAESEDVIIRYTSDGSTPGPEDAVYMRPLRISPLLYSRANISELIMSVWYMHHEPVTDSLPKAVVIRAAAFSPEGIQRSPAYTHTYLLKNSGADHGSLPVVSIAAAHEDLFDHETGIFVLGVHYDDEDHMWTGNFHQRGREWERPISFELFESDHRTLRTDAGMRTHGNISRSLQQKALRIYARSSDHFDFPFFPEKEFSAYRQIVLKTYSATRSGTAVEDPLSDRLAKAVGLTASHTRPAVVYINGEYWGLYHLKERIYPETVARHWGEDAEALDIVEDWFGNMQEGDSTEFAALYNFIEDYDMSNPHFYEVASARIDMDNFIDYQIYQMFIANGDWPANNMKMAKPRRAGSKWRWIYFDGDYAFTDTGFDAFENALSTYTSEWPTNARSTLWLRKFLENPDFYDRFFERMDAWAATALAPEHTLPAFAEIAASMRPEIRRQSLRYGVPESEAAWDDTASGMIDFLENRYCVIRDQVKERFEVMLNSGAHCADSEEENTLNVYPNPLAGNDLSLMLSNPVTGEVRVNMYTVAGQQVFSRTFRGIFGSFSQTLRIPELAPGLYVITVRTDSGMHSAKVVVDAAH